MVQFKPPPKPLSDDHVKLVQAVISEPELWQLVTVGRKERKERKQLTVAELHLLANKLASLEDLEPKALKQVLRGNKEAVVSKILSWIEGGVASGLMDVEGELENAREEGGEEEEDDDDGGGCILPPPLTG